MTSDSDHSGAGPGAGLPDGLPAGLTSRPLEMADARAVFELMADAQRVELGRVEIEEADIVGDWQRPSFDVGRQTVGVFDGDRLVAYAEAGVRGDAAVHPDHLGRGIGTWLAHRMQELGRELGLEIVGMPVPQGSAGDRLLESLGYHVRWTSWVLSLGEGEIEPRALPEGYAVRAADQDSYAELRELHSVIDASFLEWGNRDPEPYADFAASILQRPGFEPWNLRVVTDPDGRVAAAAVVMLNLDAETPDGYIARVATRADQRHRGLAQALLVDSFTTAREHGAVTSSLSTDSRTGALGLYEKVGMRVIETWVNRAIVL